MLPFWTALGWIGVLKLWVAAFGMFLLGRALGMRFGGALLAGIVFALNLKMVTWLILPAHERVDVDPLAAAADRSARAATRACWPAPGWRRVVALQFLAGHPESSFHALLAAVAFLALRLWQARRAGAAARDLSPAGAAGVRRGGRGGAALAAVSLIPFAELLWQSADFHDRRGHSVDIALELRECDRRLHARLLGPAHADARSGCFVLERALYVGALPLMLVAAALVAAAAGRADRGRRCSAACGFAVVLGIPPFLQIVTRLPVFNSGHNSAPDRPRDVRRGAAGRLGPRRPRRTRSASRAGAQAGARHRAASAGGAADRRRGAPAPRRAQRPGRRV